MEQIIRLDKKTAIVTGAGSGIGKGCAQTLAQAGASVVVADINLPDAEETCAQINSTGGKAIPFEVDITNRQKFNKLVEDTIKKLGGIDILVNVAGINKRNLLVDMPEEDWRRIIEINLTGTWIGCKAVTPVMIAQKHGKIINIASGMATTAMPAMAAYCASKGGVTQLTRVLALELAEHNIQVNAISPGYVLTKLTEKLKDNTEMYKYLISKTPMGRFGEVDEIASSVLFVASDLASFMTGANLCMDGGWNAW